MHEWRTEWTGSYPNYCCGEWHLYRDDEEIDLSMAGCPFAMGDRHEPADTHGWFPSWYFDENWQECWDSVESGLGRHAWIRLNQKWLRRIAPRNEWPAIYRAFKAEDWRHNCCGGCI